MGELRADARHMTDLSHSIYLLNYHIEHALSALKHHVDDLRVHGEHMRLVMVKDRRMLS